MPEPPGRLPIDPDLDATDPAQPTTGRPPGFRPAHRRRADLPALGAMAVGGMAGASARYGVARWLSPDAGELPWATLLTNLAGCYLLGLLMVILVVRLPGRRLLRLALTTGALGAFTTMATLQVETALLIDDGHVATALVHLVASLGVGLLLTIVGMQTARAVTGGTR